MFEMKNAKTVADLKRGDAVAHPGHYAGDGEIECMDYLLGEIEPENGITASGKAI